MLSATNRTAAIAERSLDGQSTAILIAAFERKAGPGARSKPKQRSALGPASLPPLLRRSILLGIVPGPEWAEGFDDHAMRHCTAVARVNHGLEFATQGGEVG